MRRSKPNPSPLTDPLRKRIIDSGISVKKLSEQTEVDRASISRFLSGERSLRLDVADKLAAYFGMKLKG
jgi:plasmid maintenance system antidote protein VapI